MALLSTVFGNVVSMATSQLQTVQTTDAFMSAFFANMAAGLLADHPDMEAPFATVAVAMGTSTALQGLIFWLMGAVHLGRAVQFVPTPVVSGYLASIGYLLLNGTVTMLTGCSIIAPGCVLDAPEAPQLLTSTVLGLCLYLTESHTTGLRRSLIMPCVLIVTVAIFQTAQRATGDPLNSWKMHVDDSTVGSLLHVLVGEASSGSGPSWGAAIYAGVLTCLVSVVPAAIKTLLVLTGYDKTTAVARGDTRDINFDLELRACGYTLVAASLGSLGNPAMSITCVNVATSLGSRTLLPNIIVTLSSVMLCFTGCGLIALAPQALFASMLANSGFSLLLGNVGQAWRDLGMRDFAVVLAHVACTVFFGMTAAVALGFLITAILFIIEHRHHSGILHVSTLQLERSTFDRLGTERATLDAHGAAVLVVHLHGHLFFASASSVHDAVRAHIKHLHERSALVSDGGPPTELMGVLLDCDRCTAIDATAVSVLMQTKRVSKGAPLVFASVHSPHMVRMIERAHKDRSAPRLGPQGGGHTATRGGVGGAITSAGSTRDALRALGLQVSVDHALEAFENYVLENYGDRPLSCDTESCRSEPGASHAFRPSSARGALPDHVPAALPSVPASGSTTPEATGEAAREAKRQMIAQFIESLSRQRTAESAQWLHWLPTLLEATELVELAAGDVLYDTSDESEPLKMCCVCEGYVSVSIHVNLSAEEGGGSREVCVSAHGHAHGHAHAQSVCPCPCPWPWPWPCPCPCPCPCQH